eukprot:UN15988
MCACLWFITNIYPHFLSYHRFHSQFFPSSFSLTPSFPSPFSFAIFFPSPFLFASTFSTFSSPCAVSRSNIFSYQTVELFV